MGITGKFNKIGNLENIVRAQCLDMLLERITHINIIAEDAEKLENIIREEC